MLGRLRDYYHRISARHRAYLPVVPMCMLLATGWQVYRHLQQTPQFTSSGRVMVSGRMNLPEANAYSEELSNFLGTQLEILQSADLAARARQQVQMEHPEQAGTATVKASLLRGTSILVVEAVGANADYTTSFLDALLEQFIESRRDRRMETTYAAMRQIREELPRVERQLATQEEELFRFKERHNMGYWGRQSADSAQLLSQLRLREANLRMQLSLAEALEDRGAVSDRESRLSALGATGGTAAPASADPHATEQLAKLRADLIRLRVERDQLLATFKPKHPRVIRLDQEIARQSRLLELLGAERDQAYRQTVAAMRSELTSVLQAIEEWEKKALESTRTEAEYEKLQSGLSRTRDLYSRLLGGLQSIDVGQGVNVDIVQILQRATPAQAIARPLHQPIQNGLSLGLLAGIALLLGLAKIDQRAYAIDEILAATKCDTSIEIPHLPALSARTGDPSFISEPPAPLREAMRHLHAALGITHEGGRAHTIFCVSSSPSEGKSTLSLHLALHASGAGRRTLLIDADLRRGHLAETMGLNPEEVGFAELIEGKLADWRAAIRPLPGSDLHFISRGESGSQTVDYLSRWLTPERMTELKQHYEMIVIDAAPLLPVADSLPFLSLVDHVVMVARLKVSILPLIDKTAALIRRQRQQNAFLVINGVKRDQGGYSYYGGYGY